MFRGERVELVYFFFQSSSGDETDLEFIYDDADTFTAEVAGNVKNRAVTNIRRFEYSQIRPGNPDAGIRHPLIRRFVNQFRVPTGQGKVREKIFFSRSGKSQGILSLGQGNLDIWSKSGKSQGILGQRV